MAKAKTRRGTPTQRAVRAPAPAPRAHAWRPWLVGGALIVIVAIGAFLIARNQADGSGEPITPAAGLPDTPDYHSLLVSPTDSERLLLGTHAGIFESTDGGKTWASSALRGQDAMNLVPSGGDVVWTAGHNVLARSTDGGATWSDVQPDGLPSLDVHGFAQVPADPDRLYAAVAGEGLYRSTNGGESFELVSTEVGPAVFGLAVLLDDRILAGDTQQGLMASEDAGTTWTLLERFAAAGLAVNPNDRDLVLAAGQGSFASGILASRDGGDNWTTVKTIEAGAGPVAWAASEPTVGYAVGFDRRLYRTDDSGASWKPVS